MTQYQINIDDDLLHTLFEGNYGLKRLVEEVVNQVLQAEVTEHLQAQPYERTEDRRGYRNGYRVRPMKTRIGTLELAVPKVRNGHFSPRLFSRYQRSEQALVLALMEMVINGVSTRKVRRITEELCGIGFSKTTVSELCKRLDPVVRGWNERKLDSGPYPFLLVDAMQLKVRKGGRVVPQSALLAVGINHEGYREILGLQIGDSESEDSWSRFFEWLKGRGLKGLDLVVSDSHGGLVNAVQRHFLGVSWQRCQTHFKRNVLDACPKKLRDRLAKKLRLLFDAPDLATARSLLEDVLREFQGQAPRAIQRLEDGFDDATAVMVLPECYQRRLRSTNSVERLIREVRQREKVIGIIPNVDSAIRLLGAFLMEQDEEWSTGRRYLNLEEYWDWKEEQKKASKTTAKREAVA